MKIFFSITLFITLFTVFAGDGLSARKQNMSGSVITQRVHFDKGKSSATLSGKAKYAMSYVYNLGAQKDQIMTIHLTSRNNLVEFSLIRPDQETMDKAFSVTEWQGKLPQKGDYSIVVVMNDDKAKVVDYTLDVAVQ